MVLPKTGEECDACRSTPDAIHCTHQCGHGDFGKCHRVQTHRARPIDQYAQLGIDGASLGVGYEQPVVARGESIYPVIPQFDAVARDRFARKIVGSFQKVAEATRECIKAVSYFLKFLSVVPASRLLRELLEIVRPNPASVLVIRLSATQGFFVEIR